jgi:hypothetical protein
MAPEGVSKSPQTSIRFFVYGELLVMLMRTRVGSLIWRIFGCDAGKGECVKTTRGSAFKPGTRAASGFAKTNAVGIRAARFSIDGGLGDKIYTYP